MTESRACPECGAEVPAARLSCGACGALLASVEGHVSSRAMADGTVAADPMVGADPAARTDLSASVLTTGSTPASATLTGSLDRIDGPAPDVTVTSVPDVPAPPPPMPPLAGAYLPPSTVMRGAPVTPAVHAASTPATALGARFQAPRAPSPGGPTPAQSAPGQSASAQSAPVVPTKAPVLDLPFVIAPGLGPRLVAVGAALAVVAFVLPWITGVGVVIGGSFGSGYFTTWGLAAIGNIIPFLLAWVSLILTVLPNRVPRVAALGVLPVFLGGVLGGYAWTYLIGPFGAGIGIWALAAGAFLLVAGGSLVLRHDRATG